MNQQQQHHRRRTTTSKEHKAAVELASQRRQLAKVLKREGLNPAPVFEAVKRQKSSTSAAETAAQEEDAEQQNVEVESTKPRIRNEAERAAKLKLRKKRTQLLTKKTKRGQPIMRHVINDLVSKLGSSN